MSLWLGGGFMRVRHFRSRRAEMDQSEVHLYCGPSGWELPLLHPEDMAALTLVKVAGLDCSLRCNSSHAMTATHCLPYMHVRGARISSSTATGPESAADSTSGAAAGKVNHAGNHAAALGISSAAGLHAIRQVLRTRTGGMIGLVDRALTKTQLAESDAFASLLQSTFTSVMFYEWYLDDVCYEVYIKEKLAEGLTYPMSWLNPMKERRRVRQALESGLMGTEQGIEQAYQDADLALSHFSSRLGSHSEFFYGGKPASIDAFLFGYLSCIVYSPIQNSRLRDLLLERKNLVQFCHTMRSKLYPDLAEQMSAAETNDSRPARMSARSAAEEAARRSADTATKTSAKQLSEAERSRRWRNKIFISACVISFVGYALNVFEFEGLSFS
ncbi:Metaxin-3 [Porphyridium purpureum]|uniref:Metaxin-3 n=1 Tax=Porphyridium purpureum TaxID=35688 RepID=A0A5J4YUE6_PORPP|nr:Metaxin-3 [Porphyridium purpureum]|eukprot:POR8409..scf227_4